MSDDDEPDDERYDVRRRAGEVAQVWADLDPFRASGEAHPDRASREALRADDVPLPER